MQQHSLKRRAGELCDPGKQHAPGGGAAPPHRALASMVQPDGSAVEKIHLRAPALRIVPFRFLGLADCARVSRHLPQLRLTGAAKVLENARASLAADEFETDVPFSSVLALLQKRGA